MSACSGTTAPGSRRNRRERLHTAPKLAVISVGAGNPYGLPAKDRSGRLDETELPDLGALLAKINRTARSA